MPQQSGTAHDGGNSGKSRILLVDDDLEILDVTTQNLEMRGFEVVAASNVNDALRLISNESFDVLLSDLHMPDVGDGLTVVSAMRHAHPKAVTILVSGYPALQDAMNAIMLQADEVLLKSLGMARIAEIIKRRLSTREGRDTSTKVRVAAILDAESAETIESWMTRVEHNTELLSLKFSREERTGHLPRLLADLSLRLRSNHTDRIPVSVAAREHGVLRRNQGYTIAMIVEESRMLQVSIFNTLQNNLSRVDFDTLLFDVMTIADEVDAQLKQAVLGFTGAESPNTMQAIA